MKPLIVIREYTEESLRICLYFNYLNPKSTLLARVLYQPLINTKTHTMKNLNVIKGLVLSLGLFATNLATAQQVGIIWTTVKNFNDLGVFYSSNQIGSKVPEINAIIEQFDIDFIEQALPASRNSDLQKVYEIRCNCDETELLVSVSKLSAFFQDPEIGPHYTPLYTPNDVNIMFSTDYALDLIRAFEAWDITQGDSSVKIGISDAGFNMTHPEFQNKTTYLSSGIGSSNVPHGTAVAICAAGETDNGIGKSSIGFNSSLQLYGMNYNELLVACYSGSKVINASWASGCFFSSYAQQVADEIYNNGVILVAAAGNGGTCSSDHSALVYPAALEHVISVTSIGPNDNHERIPNDPSSTHQHNNMVDICAPGYDIALSGSPTWYTYGSGTSFAAPIVSGAIGLMLAVNPCLSPDDVEYLLKSTADTNTLLINPNYAFGLGAGRLNAAAAVAAAQLLPTLNANVNHSYSCDDENYLIEVTGLDGIAPYTVWSNGTEMPGMTFSSHGDSLNISVLDSMGCVFNSTIELTHYEGINVETVVTPISCFGTDDGKIEIISTNPNDYSYNWSTGSTNSFINNLSNGFYQLVIEDSLGCSKYYEYTLNEPLKLEVNLELEPKSNGENSIVPYINGGTAPYTLFWSDNYLQTNNLQEGYYALTVIDNNGCSAKSALTIDQGNDLGIEEKNTNFQIFPNPAVNTLSINISNIDLKTIYIREINGKIISIISKNFSDSFDLDISSLSAGTYFIDLETASGQVESQKFIKAYF